MEQPQQCGRGGGEGGVPQEGQCGRGGGEGGVPQEGQCSLQFAGHSVGTVSQTGGGLGGGGWGMEGREWGVAGGGQEEGDEGRGMEGGW